MLPDVGSMDLFFFYWDDRYGQSKNWGMLSLNSCLCNFKDRYKLQLKLQKAEPLASQSVLSSLEGNTEFGCSELSCKINL